MNLDKEKTVAFINNMLALGAFLTKLTPNQNDDAVVAALQSVMANQALLDIIFDLLNRVHIEKKADAELINVFKSALENV